MKEEGPPSGTITYPTQDVSAVTAKSAGLSFAISGGFTYGLMRLFNHFSPGSISHGAQLGIGAGTGAFGAAFNGFKSNNIAHIRNRRAELLNKYKDIPEIQRDIFMITGGPDYHYKSPMVETGLNLASSVSLLGWMLSSPHSRFSRAMIATTALTSLGWIGTNLFGVSNAGKQDSATLAHAEKLALERAAARAEPAQKNAK